MDKLKPKDSSTPVNRIIHGRKGIKDKDMTVQSPILMNSSESESGDEEILQEHQKSCSDNERDNSYSGKHYTSTKSSTRNTSIDKSGSSTLSNKDTSVQSAINSNYIMVLIFVAVVSILLCSCLSNSKTVITIEQLKDQFPKQNDVFWTTVESSVKEIINFNKPSVIVFIYDEDSEISVQPLLRAISRYANCFFSECEENSIFFLGSDLNTQNYLQDYGRVITDLKPQLESRNVMIIHNVDHIHGSIAQFLHTSCDEYTPMVEKSLFLFTIKGEGDITNLDKFVFNRLHQKWSDVDMDKLEPLLTRVTNIVLKLN